MCRKNEKHRCQGSCTQDRTTGNTGSTSPVNTSVPKTRRSFLGLCTRRQKSTSRLSKNRDISRALQLLSNAILRVALPCLKKKKNKKRKKRKRLFATVTTPQREHLTSCTQARLIHYIGSVFLPTPWYISITEKICSKLHITTFLPLPAARPR